MKMQDACEQAGVTRKAALFAMDQGFLAPAREENGYRNFSQEDVARLRQVAILRRLALTGEEIRKVIAHGSPALGDAAVRQKMRLQREAERLNILSALSQTNDWDAAEAALTALQAQETVSERILAAFPGYFGHYLALHFAAFWCEPICTQEQRDAYETILGFLDAVEEPKLSPEAKQWLEENTSAYTPSLLCDMTEQMREAMTNPESWLEAHHAEIADYQAALSEIPADHPLLETRKILQQFVQASGYQTIFLPAMRRLSPAYDQYALQLEQADACIRQKHPEWMQTPFEEKN